MISIRAQIEQLEKGQMYAWKNGDTQTHSRITKQLNELYKEQEAQMKDRLARCAELRRGLIAYRVFSLN